MNQPTSAPTQKMAAVGIAGSLTVIIVYLLSLAGIIIPEAVSAALTVVISFIAGYITQERKI